MTYNEIIHFFKNDANIIIHVIRKVILSIWGAVNFTVVNYTFSKILIFPWKLEFYYRQQMLSNIFLEMTVSVHLEKCLLNTQSIIHNYSLSVNCSFKWKKEFCFSFPRDNQNTLLSSRSALGILFISSQHNT